MATELLISNINVDDFSPIVYSRTGVSDSFQVKNVGANTVYLNEALLTATGPVNLLSGWPLAPGESVTIPGYDDPATGALYGLGMNTNAGSSMVIVLDHQA